MPDQTTSPIQTVIQGAGNWAGYIGAGASNLTDPARFNALYNAGLGNMAIMQNPQVSDAIMEAQKQAAAFSNPVQGLNLQSMANMPLGDIARQYGERAAEGVQSYFTYNPTEKALDIAQQYARQSTGILSSGGIQQYLGTTGDKRFAVYSEAGGEAPFKATTLTEYQKGALGDIFKSGNVAALAGVRGVETMTSPLIMGAYEAFLGPRTPTPAPTVLPKTQVEQTQIQPQQGPLNLIGDFFGGFAKSGYAAGASAIQPFAGAREYTPVYETLMAAPKEERLVGGKTIASVGVTTPNYLVDSGEGVKLPFVSARFGAKEQPTTPFTEQAIAAASQRAGYTPLESLGDVRTEQATKAYELASKAFGLMGMKVASPDIVTGRMIETQREAATTPREQQFFGGELQKWAENKVELASAYHDIGQVAGKPIPANPYEYTGDLAVEFLKGTPTKASERFSPVSGELSGVLPVLGGLQGYAWESAKATEKGIEQPAKVSFMPAVNYLGASEGLMGPYGALAGGTGAKYVTPIAAPESAGPGVSLTGEMRVLGGGERLVGGKTIAGSPMITTEQGEVKAPFVSANLPRTTVEEPTGEFMGIKIPGLAFFQPETKVTTQREQMLTPGITTLKSTEYSRDALGNLVTTQNYETVGGAITTAKEVRAPIAGSSGLDRLNESIRSGLNLPSVKEGEAGIRLASLAFPSMGALTMPGAIETALTGKTTTTETFNPFAGQYKAFYEQPLAVPLSYAIGFGFGGASGAISKGVGAVRGLGAESAISGGGTARAAFQFGDFVMETAPKALGALYAADVAGRATKGFTTFEPSTVAPALRGIVMQEAVPMGAGFSAPRSIVKAAQLSDIGYKSALQEGATTGRLQYYVGEPVSKPVRLLAQDYAAFKQESAARPDLEQFTHLRGSLQDIAKQPEEHAVFIDALTGKITGVAKGEVGLTTPEAFETALGQAVKSGSREGYLLHTHPKTAEYGILEHPSDIDVPGSAAWRDYALSTKGIAVKSGGVISEKGISMFNVVPESPYAPSVMKGFEAETGWRAERGLYSRTIEEKMNLPERLFGTSGPEYYQYEATARGKAVSELSSLGAIESRQVSFTAKEPTYGPLDYIAYKTGFRTTPAPEISRATVPPEMEFATGGAYGKTTTLGDILGVGKGIAKEPTTIKYAPPEIPTGFQAEAAYGKQSTIFDVGAQKTKSIGEYLGIGKEAATAEPHPYSRYVGESKAYSFGRMAYPEATEPLGIKVRSYLQEKQPLAGVGDFWNIYLRHPISGPTADVSSLNRLAAFQRETGIMGIGGTGTERGVGVFRTGFGGASTGGITKTFGGGGEPPRVSSTKVIGGRTVPALVREPSLKSQGIATPSGEGKGVSIGRVEDFRGRPVSGTMKPMGKQAAGVSLLSEPLSKVEGMTEGKVSPQYGGFPTGLLGSTLAIPRTGITQTVEPSLEFTQARRAEQEARVAPVFALAGMTLPIGLVSKPASEVAQEARRTQAVSVSQDIARKSGLETGQKRETLQERAVRFAQEQRTREETRQEQRTRGGYDTAFRQDIRQRTTITPDITTTTVPRITTTKVPGTPLVPPVIPPFSLPGGGMPTGGMLKRGRKYTETLGFFVGPRTNLFAKKKIRGKK